MPVCMAVIKAERFRAGHPRLAQWAKKLGATATTTTESPARDGRRVLSIADYFKVNTLLTYGLFSFTREQQQ